MKILEQMNSIKEQIQGLKNQAVVDLPEEILPEAIKQWDEVLNLIQISGDFVEKYFQDQLMVRKMQLELEKQINSSNLHNGFDKDEKIKIVDTVINNPKIHLMTDANFREYVQRYLTNLPLEQLLHNVYNKEDIMRIGKPLSPKDSASGVVYSNGLNALEKQLETADGWEDAIAYAMDKIYKDPTKRKAYLNKYYGLDNG